MLLDRFLKENFMKSIMEYRIKTCTIRHNQLSVVLLMLIVLIEISETFKFVIQCFEEGIKYNFQSLDSDEIQSSIPERFQFDIFFSVLLLWKEVNLFLKERNMTKSLMTNVLSIKSFERLKYFFIRILKNVALWKAEKMKNFIFIIFSSKRIFVIHEEIRPTFIWNLNIQRIIWNMKIYLRKKLLRKYFKGHVLHVSMRNFLFQIYNFEIFWLLENPGLVPKSLSGLDNHYMH